MDKKAIPTLLFFVLITIFSCKKSSNVLDRDSAVTDMNFSEKMHDFGSVNQGDKVGTEFEFTNSGNVDLIITDAVGSCGCTVPEFPKNAIKPGENGSIKVLFNSTNRSGIQNKSVTITANTTKGTEILNIKANVIPRIGIAQ
ncbi:DUF1573 domain-containing protein [Flavobacterium sp. IMCC34518]|uniref:DUF1573 domain-containing protein n=1 Tax=Flavobacterium sp. IMCC34518 TaxID=3003623 RepID=UPI0024831B82|nr:DUF1573 domain-containing protein [Flavobacterium sp. IMCC34518]